MRLMSSLIVVGASLALFTCVAQAKPWAKWAPSPLASDSAYEALAARPPDSLSTSEFAWVELQRDWRGQRNAEINGGASSSITEFALAHHPRPGDRRFAELASRPYASLTNPEFAWLVAESGVQQAREDSRPNAVLVVLGFGVMVASVLGVWAWLALDRATLHF